MLIFLWVHLSLTFTIYSDEITRTKFGSETKVLPSLLGQALSKSVQWKPYVSHNSQPSTWHRSPKKDSGLRLLREDRPGWVDVPGSVGLADTGTDLGRQRWPRTGAAGPASREAV